MARYKKRKTRGGTKVMPPTTIWEWYAPETISAQVGFDATPYSSMFTSELKSMVD